MHEFTIIAIHVTSTSKVTLLANLDIFVCLLLFSAFCFFLLFVLCFCFIYFYFSAWVFFCCVFVIPSNRFFKFCLYLLIHVGTFNRRNYYNMLHYLGQHDYFRCYTHNFLVVLPSGLLCVSLIIFAHLLGIDMFTSPGSYSFPVFWTRVEFHRFFPV